jgi:uncharacterized protein DUF1579
MKIPKPLLFFILITFFVTALIALPAFAQDNAASPSSSSTTVTTPPVSAGDVNEAEMMKQMMELSKLNENHKMLGNMVGTWNFNVKMWMGDPNAKPQESKGVSVTKSIMDGRFFVSDVTGKMQMPGADGKLKDVTFKGMGTDGYDNVKKKFVGTWMDNMGTAIMMSEGDYDPATKTLNYTSEVEPVPGMKTKIREVVKITDNDHHIFEWYENRNGQEVKTMQIDYTRAKK